MGTERRHTDVRMNCLVVGPRGVDAFPCLGFLEPLRSWVLGPPPEGLESPLGQRCGEGQQEEERRRQE